MKISDVISLVAALWCSGFAIISSLQLPPRVAVHFDINGNPDRYGSRTEALIVMFIPVIVIVLLWGLDKVLPRFDTRVKEARKVLETTQIALGIFMIALQFWMITGFKNSNLSDDRIFLIAFGALFLVMGNIMPKTPPNRFVGIKLPYTFASDRAWYATHRLGGWHWVVLGTVQIVLALVLPRDQIFMALSIWVFAMFISLIYLWLYAKNQYQQDPERRPL